jgi:hypothetical protein
MKKKYLNSFNHADHSYKLTCLSKPFIMFENAFMYYI